MMLAASISSINKNSSGVTPTLIRNLTGTWYKFQRHNTMFQVNNTTTGQGTFSWKVLNLTTPGIVATSSFRNPQFTLPQGHYVLYGEVTGLNPNPVARVFFDKRITVLPQRFDIGDADMTLDLDDGNNIFDASGWGDNIKVYINKLDATVGRIRINNYTGAGAHILFDERTEVNSFTGSHGIFLVNCQNMIFDAVGTTDEYYGYMNGVGDNTSHGICLNLTDGDSNVATRVADIRCRNIEMYGFEINVTQSGASGLRVIGDETSVYNRTDTTPLEGMKFGHFLITSAGHEAFYPGYTDDTDRGFGGAPQFEGMEAWDWHVVTCGRDAIQPCNQINGRFHNWIIDECASLGEPSHNSYISHNAGNQNCKIFNIIGRGGVHGPSIALGVTGTLPMIWNCIFELETLASQTSWTFIQTDAGATTDMGLMNITNICNTGDEIVYRFDESGANTRVIDRFTLINILSLKGTSANFFTADGSPSETNWDRTSGNLSYIPADWTDADLDADGFPATVASPAIDGGVSMTTRYDYAEFLGEYDALQFEFDIDGYCKTDSDFNSGAGAGIPLKLAAL